MPFVSLGMSAGFLPRSRGGGRDIYCVMRYPSPLSLIGNSPTVRLARLEGELGLRAELYAKLEMFSLTGSVKDRFALAAVEEAERSGELKEGSLIVEPTSGNTGIGLAAVGAAKGYRVVIVMPASMSAERRGLIEAYGGEVVLTPAAEGMAGAVARAEELARREGAFLPSQFTSPVNPRTHYEGTARELWEDLGRVGAFVAGVGTGGTLTGVGKFLKERCGTTVVAVEPASSPVLSGGERGAHAIQGIGAGFVPAVLDTSVYDAVAAVTDEEAKSFVRLLARREGLFCGISSGAALAAAAAFAGELSGERIAVLLPDAGTRYLSVL